MLGMELSTTTRRASARAFAVALMSAVVFASLSVEAATSREVMLADGAGQRSVPQVQRRDKRMTIEICAETCDYFVARQLRSESEMWDVVFLHRAFFDVGTKTRAFRMQHAAHTSSVLAAYARNCAKLPQDVTRASCIVKYLARRNGINYAFVRYEGSQRCETPGDLLSWGDPGGKAKCAARP